MTSVLTRSYPLSKHIQRYSRPKLPWKPVVMGYYRCESAERTCGWFGALCNQFRVLLFVQPGHGQFYLSTSRQLSEIMKYAVHANFFESKAFVPSRASLLLSFSHCLLSCLSLKVSRGTAWHNGRNRHARYLYKRAGVGGEGGRVRGLARETSSTK